MATLDISGRHSTACLSPVGTTATPAMDWLSLTLTAEASPSPRCPGSGMALCSYLTPSGLMAPRPLAGSCGMEPSSLLAHPQKRVRTRNPFVPYIKDSPTLGPLDNALLKYNSPHLFPIKPGTSPLSSTTMAESHPAPTQRSGFPPPHSLLSKTEPHEILSRQLPLRIGLAGKIFPNPEG